MAYGGHDHEPACAGTGLRTPIGSTLEATQRRNRRAARVHRLMLEIAETEWRICALRSHSGSNKEEG